MQEEKKLLRETVKRRDKTLAVNVPRLIESIEQLPRFEEARTVALYHALPDEISTAPMLERWSELKRLALPVIRGGEMTFREYTGPASLQQGPFGIKEPREGTLVKPEEIDLMLVPGVAFDASGHRLGRGGGFYDRYLGRPAASHIYKVGLCRPEALIPEVPTEPHDIKMDRIIFGS